MGCIEKFLFLRYIAWYVSNPETFAAQDAQMISQTFCLNECVLMPSTVSLRVAEEFFEGICGFGAGDTIFGGEVEGAGRGDPDCPMTGKAIPRGYGFGDASGPGTWEGTGG